jgi:hypothetical protein
MSSEPDPNTVPDANAPVVRTILRTVLLAVSIVLLFPNLLGGIAGGAWPRLVLGMGVWKWVAWAACFVALGIARFSGGPKRGT